jgi:raffinose/stachyose/melibiose transport system substrate-binding protein
MKKLSLFLVVTMLIVLLAASFTLSVSAEDPVTLIFSSWRTEDIDAMNRINSIFTKEHPNIIINFQPVKNTEYDAQVTSSLQGGVGPDIMLLRSYSGGKILCDSGFLSKLNDAVPVLKTFPQAAKDAWSTEDGIIYGVPSAGVTHGIFYNKEIFDKYGLKEPTTWAEFLSICKTLKSKGERVLAAGYKDQWQLYEVLYSGLGPNFYGGEKNRQKLMAGEMKMTDEPFVKAFRKIKELEPYFPKGAIGISYSDSQQMFITGQAAIYYGGSWEIGTFERMEPDFKIGWFPPPVEHKGDTIQYCFHVDCGIGMNKATKYPKEALEYMKWIATPEYAQALMNELPGFFSYTPGNYTLNNSLAKENIDVVPKADITVRTTWQKLSAQEPSGNILMWEAMFGLLTDKYTPEEAAAHVQSGLEQWYKPFKK